MIFLGVDGGGSSTNFILINEKGKILSKTEKETCHYKDSSFKVFKDIIYEGIQEICMEANVRLSDINYSYLGIPAYGEIVEDMPILEDIINKIFQESKYKIGNDAEAGWAGSLAAMPGINIVAGTGAIAFGVSQNNKSARSSGWGHFVGDEGSAYWIGKKLIEVFSKESDGRLEKTPLYKIVKKHFNLQNDFELIDIMTKKENNKRNEIAKLAKLVSKAANLNDKQAIKIFREAAFEHFISICSVINQLDFNPDQNINISYSGGVFKSDQYILEPLIKLLSERYDKINLITPILPPLEGSALYASKLFLGEVKEEIVTNLKNNSKD